MMSTETNAPFGIAPPDYRLPAATHLGTVCLQVRNLDLSVAYYREVIGFDLLWREGAIAGLGVAIDGEVLIELHERAGIKPVPAHGRLGLFHVAILVPDRASLGRFLSHVSARHEQIGMSDHFVSEALYLTDPDGLGLEVYADRAPSTWRVTARQLTMGTVPLDATSVLAAAHNESWTGAPSGTRIGHVHLHVGDIAAGAVFYHEALGLDQTVWEYPGALFLSAGGYHHHLGTNTWARNATAAPEDEARLLEWTIVVPTATDIQAVVASCKRHGIGILSAPSQVGADHTVTGSSAVRIADPWGTVVCVRTNARQNS